jgi:hypothetical protein
MGPIFFLTILGITSISIIIIVYLFLKRQSQKEQVNLEVELKKQRQEFFLPNRVEAYQRAILFLERINPNSLVMRMQNPEMPASMFQAQLLKTIRDEYDHNVAQQLFISPLGWKLLQDAKEETIKLINISSGKIGGSTDSIMLSSAILASTAEVGDLPTNIAVEFLKKELQSLF